ncbi:MAG: pilin [Candidatus Saccharibacteria bacterium]|nr:pilin [Candidatus Saccharibacteria bacterium]
MKKILTIAITIFISCTLIASPVFASNKCVLTAILGSDTCDKDGNQDPNGAYSCSCDSGGDSIKALIKLVLNVLSIGGGLFCTIGIVWSGLQYSMAGGDEQKTRTAKRRILNMGIGLIVFAVGYAVLRWLIPGFSLL